ncbi:hypothetical protein BsWGS_16045 [Bradybaena similaris]
MSSVDVPASLYHSQPYVTTCSNACIATVISTFESLKISPHHEHFTSSQLSVKHRHRQVSAIQICPEQDISIHSRLYAFMPTPCLSFFFSKFLWTFILGLALAMHRRHFCIGPHQVNPGNLFDFTCLFVRSCCSVAWLCHLPSAKKPLQSALMKYWKQH